LIRLLLEKLDRRIRELQTAVYQPRLPVAAWRFHNGPLPTTAAAPGYDDAAWPELRVGERWGGSMQRAWFRRRVRVPEEWAGKPVCLLLSLHFYLPGVVEDGLGTTEALVYVDGAPVQAVDRHHREVLLTGQARGGEEYSIAVQAFAGMNPGLRTFGLADLAVINREAEGLYFDAKTALDSAQLLDEKSLAHSTVLNALNEALLMVEAHQPWGAEWQASLPRAREHLRAQLAAFDDGRQPTVLSVGHAHIDVAWLWPLHVTREKAARTFATALRLMEQYPGYHFLQSQPQLYQYVKEDQPALYERIKARVREGRWEATGGMWLEADTNVPSGESLVRQFLFGKRFFRREFGVDNDLLWLPDVFGYTAALPGIMAGCGIRYFMTTKISWNEINRFPYDTFHWQGIDGTRILTHFATGSTGDRGWFYTYNADTDPRFMVGSWAQYAQKGLNDEILLSYGHGDGGGGPTKEMLETAARLQDFPGIPHCVLGTAEGFFQRLAAREVEWPHWVGELYLEFHRGTYTTQARNKRNNRKSELLYHEAEWLAAMANWLGAPYPREQLNQGWEMILLNQFHDILPGSSIGLVYEDCARDYARIRELGEGVRSRALQTLAMSANVPGRGVLVYNPTSWARDDVAVLEPGEQGPLQAVDAAGNRRPLQALRNGRYLLDARAVPAYGYAVYTLEPAPEPAKASTLAVSEQALENRFFRVQLNERGEIASLYDKERGREVLPAGVVANEWQAFDDRPRTTMDAWDINTDYEEKRYPLTKPATVCVIEQGPLRAGVEVRRPLLNSALVQRIYIYEAVPRIDFQTEIEWQEKHVLLKVAFPVDVHAEQATYEIQFGNLQRPTHRNTSWDAARFEVPAHKWADLSEGDYGVSLLNDCKYGYDAQDNTLRLTVLRSPASPDPHADEGHHELTYALYPHGGDWRHGTVQQAYALNLPLGTTMVEPHGGMLPPRWSLVTCSADHVVIETVKVAEDAEELILRLYECYNQRGRVTLHFGLPVKGVYACNLIEDGAEPLPLDGNQVTLDIKPYQVRAIKVRLARSRSCGG